MYLMILETSVSLKHLFSMPVRIQQDRNVLSRMTECLSLFLKALGQLFKYLKRLSAPAVAALSDSSLLPFFLALFISSCPVTQ